MEDRSGHAPQQRHQLPAPADFPALEHYTFTSVLNNSLQLGDTPLQSIEFSCNDSCSSGDTSDTLPPDASAGTLRLASARVVVPPASRGGRPLLAAAVPRGKQLHTLELHLCEFGQPGALPAQLGPQQLVQLRQLQLSHCCGQRSMLGVVQALLSSAPQLEGLKFMLTVFGHPGARHLHSFPIDIFSHPALIRAEVGSMDDEEWDVIKLPPLPNPRLELLHVVGFTRLPPALAAVTSLTELRLGSMQPFRLGKRGLVALQQLHRLATLVLPHMASEEDERRVGSLQHDRPQLHVLRGGARRHQTCYFAQ